MMKTPSKTSSQIKEILTTASVRQRALLYCHEWREKGIQRQEAAITDEEARAILASLRTGAEEREFWRHVHNYNVLAQYTAVIGLARACYLSEANKVASDIATVDALVREQDLLNSIYEDLKEGAPVEVIKSFEETVKRAPYRYARATIQDGIIRIDTSRYLSWIKEKAEGIVKDNLRDYKAVIMVAEEWAREHRAKAFFPEIMKQSIEEAKEDYALKIAPQYSRKELHARIKRGERVTPAEVERAVFPYYEELNPSEDILNMWREKINSFDRNER